MSQSAELSAANSCTKGEELLVNHGYCFDTSGGHQGVAHALILM